MQEAARAAGYSGAAAALWEEFLARYLPHAEALEVLTPYDAIKHHLQRLADLYHASAPALADAYSAIALLESDLLPGVYCCEIASKSTNTAQQRQ